MRNFRMMSSYAVLTSPCHQLQNDDDNDKTSGIGGTIWENSIETCILPYVR